MFREMRRFKQVMSPEDTAAVLERGTNGILSVFGDDGYPYGVPLSYVYHDSKIYFHCSVEGHKIDAIKKNNKVSFTVVDEDKVVPEEFTTYFRSVIIFGKARILEDGEKRKAIEILAAKYSLGYEEKGKAEIEETFKRFAMVEIVPDHVSGKEAIEFVRAKNKH